MDRFLHGDLVSNLLDRSRLSLPVGQTYNAKYSNSINEEDFKKGPISY
jgi:hypothetical protein